jgi:hypothetical protein
MAQATVTLSSVGNTGPINLDWRNAAFTGVSVTGSSSGTFAYTIQTTLDDIMQVASSVVSWISDPNATALTSNSSGVYLYQQPLAGIRLASTALSSAVLTMKITQGSWL